MPRRTLLATALVAGALLVPASAQAVSPNIVISEVYGGGGNSGATLENDFIELYNRGTAAVDVSEWSVQYASSAGTSWQVTRLTGVVDGKPVVKLRLPAARSFKIGAYAEATGT